MPTYESPLGNKKIQGQPLKETVIPDESGTMGNRHNQQQVFQMDDAAIREFNNRMGGHTTPTLSADQADMEQQFREAREAKRLGRERLNEGARRRIEMLLGMTRGTRSFTIENNAYVLQTLQDQELRDAIIAAAAFDGSVQSPFEIRKQLLARSLTQVAGMDINQFVGSSDLETKLEFIEVMDHYLLSRLYDEYLIMAKEARDRYAIKNEMDAKEVVEDLKK